LIILLLGFILIGSILLLIFNVISIFYLILFVPCWFIILLFEREFIWTLIFLLKKEPFLHLSKTSGKHEKILIDFKYNKTEGES
ncbi:hypothetical protein LCGC14_3006770, partial [marine sediment metagenome]